MVNMIIQLEKAQRSAGLVRETRHVTRNGQSFNMAVWVRPGANRAQAAGPAGDDSRQGKLGIALPQGVLLAPNGKPSNLSPAQWHQCRTRAFKEWFGDWENDPENASKVVDENGEPMMVFHGTPVEFDKFSNQGKNGYSGFYFTTNRKEALKYAKAPKHVAYGRTGTPHVVSVFINIRKPKKVTIEDSFFLSETKMIMNKDQGFDGLVSYEGTNIKEYIAFEPQQIKSATGNNGAFDPKTPVISKSLTFSGWKLQGRMKFQGMQVSIENKKGSTRRGVDKDGHKWATNMHADYGYVRNSVGVDGDHVDVYIGPDKSSTRVFIINQNDPATGTFDEQKVMLGFNSPEEAKELYLKQYDKKGFFGSMNETDIDKFKQTAFQKKNYGKRLVVGIKTNV
jgi:hypothetical protein